MPHQSSLPGRCSACGAVLTRHEQFSGGVCNDIGCRRRRVDEQLRAEMSELALLRDARATHAGMLELKSAPVIALNWYEPGVGPIPPQQREAFRLHLMALQSDVDAMIAEAAAADPDEAAAALSVAASPSQPADVEPLLGNVCGRCTGFCCQDGNGRHAFLDAAAMLRARLAHPTATHADVVDGYLADIPDEHQDNSCVYHGLRGCVLPRNRRSDLCNSWECPPLVKAREYTQSAGGTSLFVVRGRPGQAPFAADFLPSIDPDRNNGH